MEENRTEEQELMPGLNIPRPRYRDTYETDEEYVEYLKGYYSKYFPEVTEEKAIADEVVSFEETEISDVQNAEITDEEIETIQTNLENYANGIEQESKGNEISMDENQIDEIVSNTTSSEEDDIDFSFDTKAVVQETEDSIEFNLESETVNNTYTDEIEVESITNSNDVLNSKIKTQSFWSKAIAYFSNIKAGIKEYFADASDALMEETLATVGHVR